MTNNASSSLTRLVHHTRIQIQHVIWPQQYVKVFLWSPNSLAVSMRNRPRMCALRNCYLTSKLKHFNDTINKSSSTSHAKSWYYISHTCTKLKTGRLYKVQTRSPRNTKLRCKMACDLTMKLTEISNSTQALHVAQASLC